MIETLKQLEGGVLKTVNVINKGAVSFTFEDGRTVTLSAAFSTFVVGYYPTYLFEGLGDTD